MHPPAHPETVSFDMRSAEEIRRRVTDAKYSANTIRNYRSAWSGFERWCRDAGRPSIPGTPGDCIDHICWCLAHGFRIETVDHRLKAVNYYHRRSGLPEPANKEVRAFLYRPGARCARNPRACARSLPTYCGEFPEN